MTNRERLLSALGGRGVDRIPWSPCMDSFFTSSLPEQGMNMDLLETLRYLRCDIMERHVPTYRTIYRDLTFTEVETPGERRRIFSTPVGELTEQIRFTGHTSYRAKHLITSPEDLRVYLYIRRHTEYEPDFEYFLQRDAFIGDDGLATPTAPLTPIQALLQELLGIENTVYFLQDYPDEMGELMELIHEQNKAVYRLLGECPSPVVFVYEDTSTTVLSRRMYQAHCARQLDEYADILHAAGKIFITHMCGKLKGFADLVKAGRQDGVDSLCPPTTGDFWAHEARACWGEEKVIIGGLEPPILVRLTVEDTIRYTADVLNRMAPGAAFILSTGDAVPYGTPIENLAAITEVVRRYAEYPLNGRINPDAAVRSICEGKI